MLVLVRYDGKWKHISCAYVEGILESSQVDGGEHFFGTVNYVRNADLADSAACLCVFCVRQPVKWDAANIEVVHHRVLVCAHASAPAIKPLAVDDTVVSSLQVPESAKTPLSVSRVSF